MPEPLPNLPMIPAEEVIRQMDMVPILNLAESFFLSPMDKALFELKDLLYTARRIFDGRAISILREEALSLYTNLGITTIADTKEAEQWDIVIAIADFYVDKSENP